jgi:hypothetical protein
MIRYIRKFAPSFYLFRGILDEEREFHELRKLSFSFREGFSNRLAARLENIIEQEKSPEVIRGLASLLPKLSLVCFGVLIVFGIILIYLNGGLNPNAFFGTEIIDESNFISFLIFQK